MDINGYQLSRSWFDFCFENPEKISPNHSAIYFFAIEHCNRLGWKDKFGFPTQMTMEAIGIKKHQTYIKYFNDLVDWGFLKLVQRSSNQYSANIISLKSARPKTGKAMDKAFIDHAAKQIESNGQSNGQSDGPIDKQRTNNQLNKEPDNKEPEVDIFIWPSFLDFWDKYEKKQDRPKCEKKWEKINQEAREKIMLHLEDYILSTPDKQYRKNPLTYLNSESWENEIITPNTNGKFTREEKVNSLRAAFAKQVIERGKGT